MEWDKQQLSFFWDRFNKNVLHVLQFKREIGLKDIFEGNETYIFTNEKLTSELMASFANEPSSHEFHLTGWPAFAAMFSLL